METKRKDISKLSQSSQEAETKEVTSKEDQAHSTENLAVKKIKTSSSPPQENASTVNPHFTSVFQWPYATAQPIQKQTPISLTSRTSLPTQQPSSQWFPSSVSQPQHGSQPFTRIGTADANWQGPIGASSRTEHQIPGMFYQGGQSHPVGMPGAWNHSPWWGQAQQSHPPCTYSFPGAYGYYPFPSPAPPPVSDSSQRGFIRVEENLSRKHQKMWGAQSLENILLWAVIGQLRADLAVYGSRVMKLEAEVSSLKSTTELPTCPATGNGSNISQLRKTIKRGRPRKVAPTNKDSQPQTHPRTSASNKSLPKTNAQEVETCRIQQVNGKISNSVLSAHKLQQTIPVALPHFSGTQGKDVNNGLWASNNGFYHGVHVIRQEGKVVPGWNFMNENATEEHDDMMMNSGKDDNEEDLEDASSGADDTNRTKFWLN